MPGLAFEDFLKLLNAAVFIPPISEGMVPSPVTKILFIFFKSFATSSKNGMLPWSIIKEIRSE